MFAFVTSLGRTRQGKWRKNKEKKGLEAFWEAEKRPRRVFDAESSVPVVSDPIELHALAPGEAKGAAIEATTPSFCLFSLTQRGCVQAKRQSRGKPRGGNQRNRFPAHVYFIRIATCLRREKLLGRKLARNGIHAWDRRRRM